MLLGGALALLTAAAYASYQLITQEVARTAPTFRIAAATAHLSVLPSLLFWHFDPPTVSLTTVGVGAALGVFSTFLPLVFLVAAIERIGAVTASMFSVIGPVVAVVIGWLFFNESLALPQAAGAALLIGSVFLLVFNRVRSA